MKNYAYLFSLLALATASCTTSSQLSYEPDEVYFTNSDYAQLASAINEAKNPVVQSQTNTETAATSADFDYYDPNYATSGAAPAQQAIPAETNGNYTYSAPTNTSFWNRMSSSASIGVGFGTSFMSPYAGISGGMGNCMCDPWSPSYSFSLTSGYCDPFGFPYYPGYQNSLNPWNQPWGSPYFNNSVMGNPFVTYGSSFASVPDKSQVGSRSRAAFGSSAAIGGKRVVEENDYKEQLRGSRGNATSGASGKRDASTNNLRKPVYRTNRSTASRSQTSGARPSTGYSSSRTARTPNNSASQMIERTAARTAAQSRNRSSSVSRTSTSTKPNTNSYRQQVRQSYAGSSSSPSRSTSSSSSGSSSSYQRSSSKPATSSYRSPSRSSSSSSRPSSSGSSRSSSPRSSSSRPR